jgi:hypothetical protein
VDAAGGRAFRCGRHRHACLGCRTNPDARRWELSEELSQIPYSSSVTINLVYDGADLDPLPQGFGFLVPAVEKRAMLACTFLHRKFPGRTAPGKSMLRAFLVGPTTPRCWPSPMRRWRSWSAGAVRDSEHLGCAGVN